MHYGVVNLFFLIFKDRPAYRDHLQLIPFQGSCKWLLVFSHYISTSVRMLACLVACILNRTQRYTQF